MADRDRARFACPDRLDITRAENRPLSFGHGIHFCLGAPLARLEAEIALGTLRRRMPDLRRTVDPETPTWRPRHGLRGLTNLPVAFLAHAGTWQAIQNGFLSRAVSSNDPWMRCIVR